MASNHLIKKVAIETSGLNFKISFSFEQLAAAYDSEENKQLMKKRKLFLFI